MKIILIIVSILIIFISCKETTEPEIFTYCDLNGTWNIHVQKVIDSATVFEGIFILECKNDDVHAISEYHQYWNFLSGCIVKGNIIEANFFNSKPLSKLAFNSKNSFDIKLYDTNFTYIEFGTGVRIIGVK